MELLMKKTDQRSISFRRSQKGRSQSRPCLASFCFRLFDADSGSAEENVADSRPGANCQSPDLASSFFLRLLNCSNIRLFDCFPVPANFRIPCSIFFFRRMKSCKKDVSFRRQQSRAGRCQSPDLTSSFFFRLLNCSIVRLFPCSSVLRHSGGDAAACTEQRKTHGKANRLYQQSETARHRHQRVF